MEHVIRIPHIYVTPFSRKFLSLLWLLKLNSPVGLAIITSLSPSFLSRAEEGLRQGVQPLRPVPGRQDDPEAQADPPCREFTRLRRLGHRTGKEEKKKGVSWKKKNVDFFLHSKTSISEKSLPSSQVAKFLPVSLSFSRDRAVPGTVAAPWCLPPPALQRWPSWSGLSALAPSSATKRCHHSAGSVSSACDVCGSDGEA